ncbi:MAG: response regulator transcription factor [Planctomycetota bacterium]|jgi:two-component system alkaline phosphatase synthesis response regulator PhoP
MTRILVVEDEASVALALQDDLELEGYTVEVVADGVAATVRAKEAPFDLILLDIMMPRKDGLEVCRELRRADLRTPIILLTARAQESDKILGLELGADDYVTKPFSPRELRARIKAVLRRTSDETSPRTYQFGDVVVDFDRCEVRREGKVVAMTTLEFKLLTTFIRLRGRALTRDRLLDEAWDSDVVVTDRVVDTHIANLRKKIEPEPARPRYLISIRGTGYRFDG